MSWEDAGRNVRVSLGWSINLPFNSPCLSVLRGQFSSSWPQPKELNRKFTQIPFRPLIHGGAYRVQGFDHNDLNIFNTLQEGSLVWARATGYSRQFAFIRGSKLFHLPHQKTCDHLR